MNEQEKAALLTFMGMTHAQAKQSDQMIVGRSEFLKPISGDIQNTFAKVLNTPANNERQYEQQYEQQYVQPNQNITSSSASSYLVPTVQDTQLSLNFEAPAVVLPNVNVELVNILKEINLNIIKIANTLEQKNDKQPRTKSTKSV